MESPREPEFHSFKMKSEEEKHDFESHDEEYSNKEDDDNFYHDSEDEEEEDFPTVYYNLPLQNASDLQKEKLLLQQKQQNLKERNQKLLQKKNQVPPLTCKVTTDPPISLKLHKKLFIKSYEVSCACYIPERNIFLILVNKRINIYNASSFTLIAVRKYSGPVTCISYSKELGKIIVAGFHHPLQLWNPKTFQVEAEQNEKVFQFEAITYIPRAKLIAAASPGRLELFTPELKFLKAFYVPRKGYESYPRAMEIYAISKRLLLASVNYFPEKGICLFNLQNKTVKALTKIFIPIASCIDCLEDSPQPIFTCLACPGDKVRWDKPFSFTQQTDFLLTQFTIDPKTEDFCEIKTALKGHSFNKLSRLEDSRCLFAQKFTGKNGFETFMLSVQKDKVEIVNIISALSSLIFVNYNAKYFIMKEGSSVIVEMSERRQISIYGYGRVKKEIEDSSK